MDIEYPVAPKAPSAAAQTLRDMRDTLIFILSFIVVLVAVGILFVGFWTLVFSPYFGALLLNAYLSS